MTRPAVSDEQLAAAVGDARVLRRVRYAYTTSWPLEEVELERGNGERVCAILKDLRWQSLPGSARAVKSKARHDPSREISTYRELLGPALVGPHCYGAGEAWLLLEKVPGVELWQIGEFPTWAAIAQWLAGFHTTFTGAAPRPFLEVYDAARRARVVEEAESAVATSSDRRAGRLIDLLERLPDGGHVGPTTLVHGELYPSNVLLAGTGENLRVWPIDWETAGVGPGAIDLAALCTGWNDDQRERLIAAYATAAGVEAKPLTAEVDRWRLHLALQWLALQWLARRHGWRPPARHDRDWLAEALDAAEAVCA